MLPWRFALLSLLQGSPLQGQSVPLRDYAIYNVVLDRLPEGASRSNALITNRAVTRVPSFRRTARGMTPKDRLGSALIESVPSPGALPPHVFDSAALGSGVRLITDSTFRSFFRHRNPPSGWMALRERYPGIQGVVDLSNITYHPNGEFAVVYVAVKCGPRCGWGGLYYLAQASGKWTIVRVEVEWVS